ncbi:MAG TPA: beta-galactosidase [Ruminiclostridium sp.]|nr:beta-galactosidase [Ruminiclostridium sp.]
MISKKLNKVFYGGDYNPDQWPEEIWNEDMRLFKTAGVNIITLPVFSWAKLQPSEDTYNFEWLDKVLDLAAKNNIYACLATPTAAQPAWMSLKYPEVLKTDEDGRKRTHGKRLNYCPNSKVYREFSAKIAGKMAERYKDHPALAVWHICNEYGEGGYCYCDNCAREFRNWLKQRYGSLEELNRVWNMSFWGHTVYSWDEIVIPSNLNNDNRCFQGMSLDYYRFMSDSMLECYKNEYRAIKKHCPDITVTTNIWSVYKHLDLFKWAECMDVAAWDNYPSMGEPFHSIALRHDVIRGLKNGEPFMLMEQTPSQQNWQAYNSLKRPGVMRLWSYQAIAHGADSVMFFQLRRSFGACEKYHGALIAHAGHENTRVFRECAKLGEELNNLNDKLLDSKLMSKAAIMIDFDNWNAVELSSGPSIDLKYLQQIEKYYKALALLNISVDIIRQDCDISKYELVIAPVLYMVKPDVAGNIESFVKNGGTFLTTYFSGIVNENDLVVLGGYPGELRKLLGIWVEEIDAIPPETKNSIIVKNPVGNVVGEYECGMLCDLLHLEGANALAVYGKDFYAGMPVLTENVYGKGKSYYVASDTEQRFLNDLMEYLCSSKEIRGPIKPINGVEVTQRYKNNKIFTFVLNHNDYPVKVDLGGEGFKELLTGQNTGDSLVLEQKGVAILESDSKV